jgi:hypothetical protein
MTHRSMCFPDFPAVSHLRDYSGANKRSRSMGAIEQGQELFQSRSGLLYLIN